MTTNVPGSVKPTAAFCCRALNRFKGGGYNRHTDSRTDGQTDRRTDGQTDRRYMYAYSCREKDNYNYMKSISIS